MPIKNLLNFSFFKASPQDAAAPLGLAESVEHIRQRAKHRLIGAAVLVLVAVVGFPLLFDAQPRPVSVDIPMDIPDKNKLKPLVIPAMPQSAAPALPKLPAAPVAPELPNVSAAPTAPVAQTPAAQVSAAASLDAKEQMVNRAPEVKTPETPANNALPAIKNVAKPKLEMPGKLVAVPKTTPPAAAPPVAKAAIPSTSDDGRKAQALLEGKEMLPPASVAAESADRYVVQVGAFADATKARETRLRVERAGLKTYTQVAETKDGKRIRVRVGPYASRVEADKAASKIKGLDLPAAILTL